MAKAKRNFRRADNTAQRAKMAAFLNGIADGIEQGDEFDSGLTFDDPTLNELYDHGVNVGQQIARLS